MQSLGERVLVCLHAPPTPHCSAPAAGGSLVSKKIWKVQGAGGLGGVGQDRKNFQKATPCNICRVTQLRGQLLQTHRVPPVNEQGGVWTALCFLDYFLFPGSWLPVKAWAPHTFVSKAELLQPPDSAWRAAYGRDLGVS